MTTLSSERLHASCVAIDGHAILIEGLSGSGKSDLALRLIDGGAALVSDDYTIATRAGEGLEASAPTTIAGKIEVRGLGIITMDYLEKAPVTLMISASADVERMPLIDKFRVIAGVKVPVFILDAHEASAPAKVRIALGLVTGQIGLAT